MSDVSQILARAHQVAASQADAEAKSLITSLADTLERRDADAKHWYREVCRLNNSLQHFPGRTDPLE